LTRRVLHVRWVRVCSERKQGAIRHSPRAKVVGGIKEKVKEKKSNVGCLFSSCPERTEEKEGEKEDAPICSS
jgi:hypothetical protein